MLTDTGERKPRQFAFQHVKTRAKQRFDYHLNEKEYEQMCRWLKRGIQPMQNGRKRKTQSLKHRLFEDRSGRGLELHSIYINGKKSYALYNRAENLIVTLLDPNIDRTNKLAKALAFQHFAKKQQKEGNQEVKQPI